MIILVSSTYRTSIFELIYFADKTFYIDNRSVIHIL